MSATRTKLNKRAWNTYRTTGYTHQVGDNPAATGGVHHHQVRKGKAGWQKRICESNGRHVAYGPVMALTDAEGESLYQQACRA